MEKKTIVQSSHPKDIYEYVYKNCEYKYVPSSKRFSAYITMLGVDYQEYGETATDARSKLATELSKSKYIQNNLTIITYQ